MSAKKSMSIRLPEPLADKLKAKADAEGVSMTEIISRFTRMGLQFANAEQLTPSVGLFDSNLSRPSMQVQEQGNGYLSTQVLCQEQLEDALASTSHPTGKQDDLLLGFEKFIGILEDSMGYLTEERNRESIVDTIGELAKLKTRLKLDPCFRK